MSVSRLERTGSGAADGPRAVAWTEGSERQPVRPYRGCDRGFG